MAHTHAVRGGGAGTAGELARRRHLPQDRDAGGCRRGAGRQTAQGRRRLDATSVDGRRQATQDDHAGAPQARARLLSVSQLSDCVWFNVPINTRYRSDTSFSGQSLA